MTEASKVQLKDLLRNAAADCHQFPKVLKAMTSLAVAKPNTRNSIGRVLEDNAARQPHRLALKSERGDWSYGAFNRWVNQIAHALISKGVRKGDAVAIMMGNCPETLACVAATVKLGAVAAMINTSQREQVLVHSFKLVAPAAYLVATDQHEAFAAVQTQLPLAAQPLLYWPQHDQSCPDGWSDLAALAGAQQTDNPDTTRAVQLKDAAYYIFTSGTTGLPKASIMTHYRWLAATGMGLAAMHMTPDDVLYCALPLYHNNALTLSWGAALGTGACLAIAPKFSASGFWDDIRRYEATTFCYIGELLRYLINQPASPADRQHQVRAVMGNGLRPELWDEFKQRFGIDKVREFYGASEGNIGFVNMFNVDRTAGFTMLPHAIVRYDIEADEPLRDARGHLVKCRLGEAGLLVGKVTAKTPFDGYTDPAANEKKLFRNAFKKGDCWFNSGDLVRSQGYMHIQFVDRLGDTFRWKGENVATTEVEAALSRYPQVEEAVVYGVQVPVAEGRAGMVALTPNVLAAEFDWTALVAHLRQTLPPYAVPLFIRLRDQQEVIGTFKYRKAELKQQGFDPAQVAEALYVLLPNADHYRVLDQSLFDAIDAGQYRF